jgi:hypothetical protein
MLSFQESLCVPLWASKARPERHTKVFGGGRVPAGRRPQTTTVKPIAAKRNLALLSPCLHQQISVCGTLMLC